MSNRPFLLLEEHDGSLLLTDPKHERTNVIGHVHVTTVPGGHEGDRHYALALRGQMDAIVGGLSSLLLSQPGLYDAVIGMVTVMKAQQKKPPT